MWITLPAGTLQHSPVLVALLRLAAAHHEKPEMERRPSQSEQSRREALDDGPLAPELYFRPYYGRRRLALPAQVRYTATRDHPRSRPSCNPDGVRRSRHVPEGR